MTRLPSFVIKRINAEWKPVQSSFAKDRYFSHLSQKSNPTENEKWLASAYEKLHSLQSRYNFLNSRISSKTETDKVYSELLVLQRQIAMRESVTFQETKARKFL